MKKLLVLLSILTLLTGCTVTKINKDSIDKVIDSVMKKDSKLKNVHFEGYSYYVPRGIRFVDKKEYNAILKDEYNNNYYLYVDVISYYHKVKEKYKVNKKKLTSEKLMELYIKLIKKYPIISIEDPFDENDFTTFKKFTSLVDIQIVGDDLFTTSSALLQKGIDEKMCNAILLKANQIGTITEMLNTIKLAKDNNYKTIISHRSGETEDTFIADFAVGLNLGQIKTGSMSRGERICKYNRLLRIEEELNN